MTNTNRSGNNQQSILSKAIAAIEEFIGLILGFIPDVLKMLRDTLRAIPPLAAGVMVAFVVTWFFLNLLTGNDTVKIIFAIALCLVAVMCMGWALLQSTFNFQTRRFRLEAEQKEALELHQQRMYALQSQPSSLHEKMELLQRFAGLLQSLPPDHVDLRNEIEGAMRKLITESLREVSSESIQD